MADVIVLDDSDSDGEVSPPSQRVKKPIQQESHNQTRCVDAVKTALAMVASLEANTAIKSGSKSNQQQKKRATISSVASSSSSKVKVVMMESKQKKKKKKIKDACDGSDTEEPKARLFDLGRELKPHYRSSFSSALQSTKEIINAEHALKRSLGDKMCVQSHTRHPADPNHRVSKPVACIEISSSSSDQISSSPSSSDVDSSSDSTSSTSTITVTVHKKRRLKHYAQVSQKGNRQDQRNDTMDRDNRRTQKKKRTEKSTLKDREKQHQNDRIAKTKRRSTIQPVANVSRPVTIISGSSSEAISSSPDVISSRSHSSRSSISEQSMSKKYFCRKSVSTAPIPSASLPTPPEAKSSPRRRRQLARRFSIDLIGLDEVQAQERELAHFQAQMKQVRNISNAGGPSQRPTNHSISRLDHVTVDSNVDSMEIFSLPDAKSPKVSTKRIRKRTKQLIRGEHTATDKNLEKSVYTECNTIGVACVSENIAEQANRRCNDSNGARDILLHPTSFRGMYVDEPPVNILPIDPAMCSPPFCMDSDLPLTAYDKSNMLEMKCEILTTFGKSKQSVSSIFLSEPSSTSQSDINHRVQRLVEQEMLMIRDCQRRKTMVILEENRRKMCTYTRVLQLHQEKWRKLQLKPLYFSRSLEERRLVNYCKLSAYLPANANESIAYCVSQGEVYLKDESITSTFGVLQLAKMRPLASSTTCIGMNRNVRVADDPILRYPASPLSATAENVSSSIKRDEPSKIQLRLGNAIDEEVAECILRLVVRQFGDSDQVFFALKTILGFSQAYTDYSEMKKLNDLRHMAARRLKQMKNLACSTDGTVSRSTRDSLVKLLNQNVCTKDKEELNKSLAGRLTFPWAYVESHLATNHYEYQREGGIPSMGLRAVDDYEVLVETYRNMFCRMCYTYDCREHGGSHPLPTQRVDPVHPALKWCLISLSESMHDSLTALNKNIVPSHRRGPVVDLTSNKSGELQTSTDASEYIDKSHIGLVTMKMKPFLAVDELCGKDCWKSGKMCTVSVSLYPSEQALIQKLRLLMGDNACLLAAILNSLSCAEVHSFLECERKKKEKRTNSLEDASRKRSKWNWKHGRGVASRSGINRESVQRTRDQRLRERKGTDHEYEPCHHEGMCDSTRCSCMIRDHMCEKACSCSRDCPNRFEGCQCKFGACRSNSCPCFVALRECNPDMCVSCGASEVAALVNDVRRNYLSSNELGICNNVNLTRGLHKKLGISFSNIHGWGVFAQEPIKSGEFVYEYTGAMVSQDEAERRGIIYDKLNTSFLFDLNEDAVVDAIREGNKSKFINHESVDHNCLVKVHCVGGEHRIAIWAGRDIKKGEEILFNYGYHGTVAPEWSQLRADRGNNKNEPD